MHAYSLELIAAAVARSDAVRQVAVVTAAVRTRLVRAVLAAAATRELVRLSAAHALETRLKRLADRT